MKQNFALLMLALAVIAAPAHAQSSQPVVEYQLDNLQNNTIPIVIAGDAQLVGYAHKAFAAHGAFSRVTANGKYTFTFTTVSSSSVRVDIAQKGSPNVTNITANGANTRDAFYRAADAAVKATTGLPGFFTSKLAFVSNNTGAEELYVSDLFLNEARALTNKRATVLRPQWSPDGRKILFTSFYKTNSADIFQIDVNSLSISDYANYRGTNMGARYSPDGGRVVMTIGLSGGDTNVYVGTPDGRSKPTALTNSPEAKASPCFSPDGQRIVFAMEPGPQLYIMNALSGVPSRASTGVNYAAEPDWSRTNPNLIVFTTQKQIGIYNTATGETRRISPKNANKQPIGDVVEPAWLPDGRHIIFTQRPTSGGQRFLYILDTAEKSDNRATQISSVYAKQAAVLAQP